MSIPTAKEILSWYLYGQSTPPAPNDLRDDRFIRPKGIAGPPRPVDSQDYMRNGGGRFVGIGNFNFVRNFLQGSSDYSGTQQELSRELRVQGTQGRTQGHELSELRVRSPISHNTISPLNSCNG
jgi:hypothetical protein